MERTASTCSPKTPATLLQTTRFQAEDKGRLYPFAVTAVINNILKVTKFQKHFASFPVKADVFCGEINVRVTVHKFLPRFGQALKFPGG